MRREISSHFRTLTVLNKEVTAIGGPLSTVFLAIEQLYGTETQFCNQAFFFADVVYLLVVWLSRPNTTGRGNYIRKLD